MWSLKFTSSGLLALAIPLTTLIISLLIRGKGINDDELQLPSSCPSHSYSTQILHVDPLVIYLEGFIRPDEASHLIELGYVCYACRVSLAYYEAPGD